MLHPLKNLPNFVTSSVNHQSASVFGTKDYAAVLWQKEASDKSDISRKRAKCVCHLH